MKRTRSLSLGAKLNLSLLTFLLLLAAATSAIIVYGFNRTQDSARERSDAALADGGRLALYAVAGGASEQGGLLFESVGEVGRRSALYVATRPPETSPEPTEPISFETSDAGHLYDADPNRVTDLVVINDVALFDARVQDDIAFSAPLDTIFPVLLQGFEGKVGGRNLDPIAIAFISTNGVTRYFPPIGIHQTLPADADFAQRMASLGPDQNPERRTIWTAPYEDGAGQGLIVTARTPVYDGDEFRGTMEVDVSMASVLAQISQLKPTTRGFAFYVDSAGTLMKSDGVDLLTSEEQTNDELAAFLEGMRANPSDEFRTTDAKIQLGGEDYFIAYSAVPVLGGSLAVAAPLSDITAAAAGIGSGIEDEGTRTLQIMLVAMAVLFVVGLVGAGILNRNAVIRPINSLVSAARTVGAGDLNARVPVADAGDELTELGVAFNSMVEQLRESERALEQRVGDRTRELGTLLDVSQSIASTIELAPLFDVILDQLRSLVDFEGAAVVLREGSELHQIAVRRPAYAPAPPANGLSLPITASAPIWDLLSRGDVVVIDDIYGDSELAREYQSLGEGTVGESDVAWIHAWSAVPLVVREVSIGFLAFSHSQPGRFSIDGLKLARAVADQAAVAIANAQLFGQTQRQARDMDALLRADAELFGSLNLDAVLQSLVDIAVDVLGADKSLVTLWDRERNTATVRAARNFSATGLDLFSELLPSSGLGSLRDDVEPTVHPGLDEPDVPPAVRAIMELEGVSSAMDVPIRSAARDVLGGYGVAYTKVHEFGADERRLLTALADRAAVAIQNAKLLDETQRQSKETEALLRADAELFKSLSLDAVLQTLVDVAVDVLGVDKSVVMLHEGDVDVIRASRNYSADNITEFNRGLANMPHEEPPPEGRKPQVYADMSEAPDFFSKALSREGVKSHMFVPVRDTHRMLGAFGISFMQEHAFTEEEQQLYGALADRAAVAIQNAELYERAQHAASLEERQRLARELHDSVSQALYGIALGTRTARLRLGDDPQNAAEPIEYVMSLAEGGLAEMRALIFELRPESLALEGLVAAIEKQAASIEARYKLAVETKLGDEPDCTLGVKEALYRIAQEALHNVVKHAQAQHVDVRLEREGNELVLTILDDGRGFDTSASFPGHVGLLSMPERASKLGGTVTFESSAGSGTRVVARVPV